MSSGCQRQAAGHLLAAAQQDGTIRPDVTAVDIFALANALSWIADRAPTLADRRDHLFRLVLDGLRPRE
ncbi:hypothetical protein [Kitasatospora sp. NPDC097643]|uniref:SbtR family transcriptional regulator n=1 Tax=Kitasatospora sp. NPDC097643 TaxID=3157230 RepID=UPI00332F5B99